MEAILQSSDECKTLDPGNNYTDPSVSWVNSLLIVYEVGIWSETD